MWDALSDERTGLSFTIAAGPRQRSYSQVRVPWDSRPYFIVSDSRLPFSLPPTTRRATVEVFDPASTRDCLSECQSRVEPSRVESYVTTDNQSASLSQNKAPIWGPRLDFYHCQTAAGPPTWPSPPREDGSAAHNRRRPLPAQPLPGPSPVGPAIIPALFQISPIYPRLPAHFILF
jgi:hypothetical protein